MQQARQIAADFIQLGQRAVVRKSPQRITLWQKAALGE